MRIALAGLVIDLVGIDADAQREVDDGAARLFAPYQTTLPPDVVHVFDLTLAESQSVEQQMRMESSRSGDGFSLHIVNQFRGEFSLATRRGRYSLPRQAPYGQGTAIQNVIRLGLVIVLAHSGGMLIHSCGVAVENQAWLFFGVSGAGKSTLAKQWPLERLLSDEMNCLTANGPTGFIAHRAPFLGEVLPPPVPLQRRLGGLIALRKGPALRVEQLGHAQASRELLGCIMNVSFDRELALALIDTVTKVCHSVPVISVIMPPPGTLVLAELVTHIKQAFADSMLRLPSNRGDKWAM